MRKELPRYSDKYRPSVASQPTLKRKDLHAPFFPPEIFDSYFNTKKKRKSKTPSCNECCRDANETYTIAQPKSPLKKRMNIDEMAEDAEEQVRLLQRIHLV